MLWKAVAVALVAVGGWGLPAAAQAPSGGPAELPPPGFAGMQYVDSRGCAFVRAGLGGQEMWVRRVGSDRRPLCGLTPTRVAMARAQTELDANAAEPAAAPEEAAASPARGGAAATGAEAADPRVPDVVVPKGYQKAWRDDRLNPNRGRGTPEGERQMASLWTRTAPQVLNGEAEGRRAAPAPAPAATTTRVPTEAAPARAAAAAAGARVQVGVFAQPANARSAEARLAALGLPVETVRGTLDGRAVEIVRAGPFASEAAAREALAAVRRAGFGDAILRR
jgi:hypothetical protein